MRRGRCLQRPLSESHDGRLWVAFCRLSEPDGLSFDPAASIDQAVAFAESDGLYLSKSDLDK